jgi:integrase/recombinase XerD
MTDAPISPLRRRMIEDMTVRKFAARTQEAYIRSIKNFSAFLGASPDTASDEDLRRYRLHLVANGAGVPTINNSLTALRFLFLVTLRKPAVVVDMPFVREPRRLPIVLSPEEVARLLDAAPGLKYKAALSVAYGAGLRASEVISLKVSDIDSARMVIRVEQGKGRKDRYVMLSEHLLELLRAWWKAARPQGWLFPGRDPVQPLTTRQLNRACHAAVQMAEMLRLLGCLPLKEVAACTGGRRPRSLMADRVSASNDRFGLNLSGRKAGRGSVLPPYQTVKTSVQGTSRLLKTSPRTRSEG